MSKEDPTFCEEMAAEGKKTYQYLTNSDLARFITESNAIEEIHREPTDGEMEAHRGLLKQSELTPEIIRGFVWYVADKAPMRTRRGMNVEVGNHSPIPGSSMVLVGLIEILAQANSEDGDPYLVHHMYETLHPFMDGNGRSGRAIWLWMMTRKKIYVRDYLFLRSWYYQSLEFNRR
jgi:hypothetical protein